MRPPWPGLGVAALLLGAEALALLLTAPDRRPEFNWFRTLSMPLLTGYLVDTLVERVTSVHRMLAELELDVPERDRERLGARVGAPLRRHLRIAFGVGLTVPLVVGVLTGRLGTVVAGAPIDVYFAAMAVVFWTTTGITAALLLDHARLLDEIAAGPLRVDLFDLRTLRPFFHQALRLALRAMGAISLAVLLAATPDASRAWFFAATTAQGLSIAVLVFLVSALVASASFVIPLLGIHRRLVREKRLALDRVRDALGSHHALLGSAHADDVASIERANVLLELRDRVTGVPEWPFEASRVRYVGLYALIPLGSWVGAAFVQEAISAFIS